jgi:SPOR domain
VPPAPVAYVAPAPRPISTAPAPAPTPAAYAPSVLPTPIAQAPPSASRYYVVTDYTGDPSLSKARQAIGDAYVRNFDDGAKVQMGAFEDSASAEQMARQLQQQGVPAQVYQP